MQYLPLAVVLLGLAACLTTLIVGLVMTFRMGSRRSMMQPTREGHWSRARRLVYGGAIGFVVCNCLFTILTWIPGALPGR